MCTQLTLRRLSLTLSSNIGPSNWAYIEERISTHPGLSSCNCFFFISLLFPRKCPTVPFLSYFLARMNTAMSYVWPQNSKNIYIFKLYWKLSSPVQECKLCCGVRYEVANVRRLYYSLQFKLFIALILCTKLKTYIMWTGDIYMAIYNILRLNLAGGGNALSSAWRGHMIPGLWKHHVTSRLQWFYDVTLRQVTLRYVYYMIPSVTWPWDS